MLRELTIANLALVERLTIDFEQGLNILTGETGAGKSIIIDAVGLALGGRFSAEMIRADAESLQVEAVFELEQPERFQGSFEEQGLTIGEDGVVILSREIAQGGRSRCRINGQTVTVQTLAKVGAMLMDIHGQHEHQSLLIPEKQMVILDAFGGRELAQKAAETATAYHTWWDIKQSLSRLDESMEEKARRMELLSFQLQEIDEAQLTPGEDETLQQEREILASAERLYAVAAEGYQRLYGGDEGGAALDQLAATERALESVASIDSRLGEIQAMIREAACQAEEAAREIRNYRDSVAFDPERLEAVERRLDTLAKLKRKYGNSAAEILEYADQIRAELNEVENREERRKKLQLALQTAQEKLAVLARELSNLRRATANRLEDAIRGQLAELHMARTEFKVDINRIADEEGLADGDGVWSVSAKGFDRVEFLVAPNVGEGLRPLSKIASGGEMSRIMLAMKAILAETDEIPTMVFDEIDSGIGGRTAQAVAEKLLLIAQSRQILCVTHLPQIASMAHRHLYIEKVTEDNRTRVTVRPLSMGQRVEELARMLGGAEVTETTRQHAREMLTLAESVRMRKVGRTL